MVEKQAALSQLAYLTSTDLANPTAVRFSGLAMEDLILRVPLLEGVNLEQELGIDTLGKLQLLYERFETDLEYDFAERIIKGETTLEEYPLFQRFQRLIQAEIELASIKDKDKVLFIGSGPFPISPILVSQQTSARVDCLDQSDQASSVSEKVIHKLGLAERIQIFNASGDIRKIYGYDVIMVALLAQPKFEILYNTQWSIPQGTRVICRTSEDKRQVFYKPTDPATYRFIGRYQLVGKHTAGTDDTISSLLFRIDGRPENR